MGRYLTRDPVGYADGLNAYAHVGNNPVNFLDPLGLQAQKQEPWLDKAYRAATDFTGGIVDEVTFGGHRKFREWSAARYGGHDQVNTKSATYKAGETTAVAGSVLAGGYGIVKQAGKAAVKEVGQEAVEQFVRREGDDALRAAAGQVDNVTTEVAKQADDATEAAAGAIQKVEGTAAESTKAVRTVTDKLTQHTSNSDLVGAAREAKTGVQHGGQHFKEVSEAAAGLRKRIGQIDNGLAKPTLTPLNLKQLADEYKKASANLQKAREALTGEIKRHGE